MNNPFDYRPGKECEEAFARLIGRIGALRQSATPQDVNFCGELEKGKMLGVLVAEDKDGQHHLLYAFSGQLGSCGFHYPGFVPPVFDYLQPDGYFKNKEREISDMNLKIAGFESGLYAGVKDEYESMRNALYSKVSEFKDKCRLSKLERDERRSLGGVDGETEAAMIRQSQFEKAELRRMKAKVRAELEPVELKLKRAQSHLDAMKEKRRSESEALQQWLFDNFKLLNAQGESRSLSEIFAETPLKIPPSGAGECCAPKLLQAAYIRGLRPVSIAEYWYGQPKDGEVRRHGEHYPACRGKCGPVLGWMLQGLEVYPPLESDRSCNTGQIPEVVYECEWFCVVDKPSGMLSVPGKGNSVSVEQWLSEKYSGRAVKMAHRLDQDTSGLIIATFGELPYKQMQTLFATRKVKKTYLAELEGDYKKRGIPMRGRIELPLCADWLDRPRQKIDFDEGKESVTDYEFTGVSEGRSRVVFHPLTGRTHQLRVHAASEHGLGMPIVGDPLYGKNGGTKADRLRLYAQRIEFDFPIDGRHYSFETPAPF